MELTVSRVLFRVCPTLHARPKCQVRPLPIRFLFVKLPIGSFPYKKTMLSGCLQTFCL